MTNSPKESAEEAEGKADELVLCVLACMLRCWVYEQNKLRSRPCYFEALFCSTRTSFFYEANVLIQQIYQASGEREKAISSHKYCARMKRHSLWEKGIPTKNYNFCLQHVQLNWLGLLINIFSQCKGQPRPGSEGGRTEWNYFRTELKP